MILESAQIVCAVANTLGIETPYKTTHYNHPCTKWARASHSNMVWLLELLGALNAEWQYRYGHTRNHKSYDVVDSINIDSLCMQLPQQELTPFALAMPDYISSRNTDAIDAYRDYYVSEKANILAYTKREQPHWITKESK